MLALPLVTLVLGYWFNASLNERQQIDNNIRLYAEMMGRREEADSNLRKDMFNSILTTFMSKDPNAEASRRGADPPADPQPGAAGLQLPRVARHRVRCSRTSSGGSRSSAKGPDQELQRRLESVALQVIEHQLTALSDVGTVERGDALTEKIKDFQAHIMFGMRAIPDPKVKPGEGAATLCLSMEATDRSRHYRQFRLELINYNAVTREVQVRLYVSQLLTQEECQRADLDLEAKREVDTNFQVGLFDFPMIDNTRLSGSERSSVSVTALNPNVVSVTSRISPPRAPASRTSRTTMK